MIMQGCGRIVNISSDMTTGLQGEELQSIMRRSPLGRLASVEDVAYIFAHLVK